MPDKKITQLVDGSPVQPTDEFVVARAGDNFKIDAADVVAAVTKHDVTISGNTAGALAAISSGTMTLAGGNNITLSQAGNAVTISALASSSLSATGAVSIVTNGSTVSIGAPAQTVQTQNMVAVTLSGNTSGALALVSSGTLTLAGGNNITVSQAGNAITISGPNVGGAQTGISGIVGSDATYTSGTVTFSGVGGGVTVNSNTGQRIDISVAAQSVQPETQVFIAGVSASDTLYTSGNVRISGSQAVTVRSGTGQLVVIDAPAQSVQPETQTFISGISASDTLYTSGQVRITGVGGGVTVSSNTGQRIDISVAAPVAQSAQTGISGIANSQTTYTSGTVSLSELGAITIRSTTGNQFQFSVNSQTAQTQNLHNITLSGNTSGAMAHISSGTMTLAGGNAITLSQAGNAVTISGPASSSLSATGAVSISVNGSTISIGAPNQTNQAGSVYAVSNTSGTSSGTYDGRTLSIAGAGIVTVAASNSGWRIDATTAAQTNQTGNIYASSNTFGTSSGTYDARSISIAGRGAVSVAASNSGWIISAPAQSVQVETQSAISGIANSQTTYTTGTVSLSELGAITIRSTTGNQFQFSVNAQTTQTQNLHNVTLSGNTAGVMAQISSGTMTLAGGNNITLSQNGNAVTISGGAGGAETQTAISGISASDTLYTSGTVRFTGSNMITVKSSAAGQTVIIDATQSVQTQGVLSVGVSTGGNTLGNTTVNTGSRFVIVGTNGITASQGTAAGATTVTLSGVTQSVQTQGILNVALSNVGNTAGDTGINSGTRMVLAGGNNITLSASSAANATTVTVSGPNMLSAGMSTGGNTSGDTGYATQRLNLAGGNNITLSGSTNGGSMSITISAPNLGAGAMSAGASNLGNTAGATGITGTQLVIVGSDNITLSQTTGANGGTLSIFGPAAGGFSAGVSTGGNTAGSTGVTGTRLVFVGNSPMSLSQSTAAAGGTISINAPATSSLSGTGGIEISTNGSTISLGYKNNIADWQNFPMGQGALMTLVAGISKTPFYWQDHIDGYLTAKSLAFKGSMVTANTLLSMSVHLGVYRLVNSTSASLLGSHSEAYVVSSATSVSLSGVRNFIMTGIGTHATLSSLSAGEYIFGMMFSAGATASMNMSLFGASTANGPLGGIYPGTNNVSAGTSQGIQALRGRGSTTVNAMPANVVASELVNQGQGASMQLQPWIYIRS